MNENMAWARLRVLGSLTSSPTGFASAGACFRCFNAEGSFLFLGESSSMGLPLEIGRAMSSPGRRWQCRQEARERIKGSLKRAI